MAKRKRPLFYRLEGRKPVPLSSKSFTEIVYGFMEELDQERHVALDAGPGWELSTVFLSMDHNHHGRATQASPDKVPPLVFETALFKISTDPEVGEGVEILARYSTWAEAESGHQRFLSQLLSSPAKSLVSKDTLPTYREPIPH